jgi:pyridoxamine 5'-phosphate oxidase
MKLHHHRKQYEKSSLSELELPENPTDLFRIWFEEAIKVHKHEAHAMVLSTVDGNKPSARVVLLKEVNEEGFVFFTNYESRKAKEIDANPYGCLTFFWPELEKQVRIEGFIEKLSELKSAEYFDSRPLQSRISAIVSPQSRVIPSREFLENRVDAFIAENGEIFKPTYWGGFCLRPHSMEFWQGRANRLHDRIRYFHETAEWMIERLAP